jgi:lysophospholipase L1-like esterase
MSGRAVTAFVGDRLTAEGRWSDGLPDDEVLNFGVAGNTTDDLIARLDEVTDARPDTVLLMIGTNDIAWNRSVEHIVRNIETIIVSLRRELPESQLVVESVLPREREFAARIKDVNRHLRQFAPTQRAQYLDLWPQFAVDDVLASEFTDDGLHLSELAYRVWLGEVRTALEELRNLPPSSRAILLPRLASGELA